MWMLPCIDVVIVRTIPTHNLEVFGNMIATVQCTIANLSVAIASNGGVSRIAWEELVSVHFTVDGQDAVGQLVSIAGDTLRTSDVAPGGSFLLVGPPAIDIIGPRNFPSGGTATATRAGAAARAQAATGASETPELQAQALEQLALEHFRLTNSSILSEEQAIAVAPTLVRLPVAAGMLQIRGRGFGVGPWVVRSVLVGDRPSRAVVWISPNMVLAWTEPGVGFDVPVSIQTLGGTSDQRRAGQST